MVDSELLVKIMEYRLQQPRKPSYGPESKPIVSLGVILALQPELRRDYCNNKNNYWSKFHVKERYTRFVDKNL